MDALKKAVDKLSTKENPVKLVFIDWATAFQHKGSNSPVRDNSNYPVLQSTWWKNPDSFAQTWKTGLEEIIVVNKELKQIGRIDVRKTKIDCAKEKDLKSVLDLIKKAIN